MVLTRRRARLWPGARGHWRGRAHGVPVNRHQLRSAVLVQRLRDPHRCPRQLRLRFRSAPGNLVLTAQHPSDARDCRVCRRGSVAPGESLLLNPTFLGRGSVRGRVLAADGVTAGPNATVALFPGSVLGSRGLQTTRTNVSATSRSPAFLGVFTLRQSTDARRAARPPAFLKMPAARPGQHRRRQ